MIIKVCGMRDADNIREVEQLFTLHSLLFTSWMGFIFWPKSSRYVSERPAYLPTKCKRVGVFVDEDIDTIKKIAEDYELDFIQLHGHESPEEISHLSLLTPNLSLIKAFNIATADDLKATKSYEGIVDYFLFDTRKPSREAGGSLPPGGTGEKFDWNVLDNYAGEIPFILSGGIGPNDGESVKSFHHPKCIGIDLNSQFELAAALKDIKKLKEFIKKIRS